MPRLQFACPLSQTCFKGPGKRWSNQDEVNGHVLKHHAAWAQANKWEWLTCSHHNCGKSFSCNGNLSRHIRQQHRQAKTWACVHCWGTKKNGSGKRKDNIKNRHTMTCPSRQSTAEPTDADFMEFADDAALAQHRDTLALAQQDQGEAPAPAPTPTPTPEPAPAPEPTPATAVDPALLEPAAQPTEGLTVGPLLDDETLGIAVLLQQHFESGAVHLPASVKIEMFHNSIVPLLNEVQVQQADEWYFDLLKASLT